MVDIKVLEQRKKELEAARVLLKQEFIGIDNQIDDVINLMSSWYIFPEGQIRPLIINLVGMTGVGKTSLIERLFDALGLDKHLYKFDMGYYSSSKEDLKYDLSKKVKSYNNQPVCFALDEFQLGRSVDKMGGDIQNHGYRPIWDLMDTGLIKLLESNGNSDLLYNLSLKLNVSISQGVRSNGLFVTKEKDKFLQIFGDDSFESSYYLPEGVEPSQEPLIIPEFYYYSINSAQGTRFDSESELRSFLKRLKDEQEVLDFVNECFEKSISSKVYDFSNSLIFTISNVDDAFYNAKDVDPDMDADIFHKDTKKIKISQIKKALLGMFRPEQVARLGNNFVIYPSFSSEAYRGIIDLELNKISRFIKEKFDFNLVFDDTIRDILYKEGVFPTQGARPTITTINNVIGSYVGKILCDVLLKHTKDKDNNLLWAFSEKEGKSVIQVADKEFSYDVKLKVNEDRKPKMDNSYAVTVVHEVGHAILSMSLLGVVPSKVVASSAGLAEGVNIIDLGDLMSADMAKKYAAMLLGGIEAEKIVFGEKHATFGAESDLMKATERITSLFETSGIFMPYVSRTEPLYDDMLSTPPLSMDGALEEQVRNIFKDARELAKATFRERSNAFNDLCKLLYEKSVINKKELREFAIEHNLFSNGENYLENFYVNKFEKHFKQEKQ